MDIRDLDLAWFRSQLGVVSQEPVLFAGSVAENIKLGALDATQDEIEEAAKLARVHDFVCKLPEVRYLYSETRRLFFGDFRKDISLSHVSCYHFKIKLFLIAKYHR